MKVSFAHDLNLQFPIGELPWKDLLHGSVGFEDMSQLTEQLSSHHFDAAYLPAGNFYYLKSDPFYEGIATALTHKEGRSTFKSVLVVKKESPFTTWKELEGKRMGYIHRYCTSSYFGASLFFYRRGAPLRGFLQMIPVGAWQKQIDAVVEKRVDGTFVMEDVWFQNERNQKTTRIIDSIDALPNPVVIVRRDLETSLKKNWEQKLLKRGDLTTKETLFSQFTSYDFQTIEPFFIEAEKSLKE